MFAAKLFFSNELCLFGTTTKFTKSSKCYYVIFLRKTRAKSLQNSQNLGGPRAEKLTEIGQHALRGRVEAHKASSQHAVCSGHHQHTENVAPALRNRWMTSSASQSGFLRRLLLYGSLRFGIFTGAASTGCSGCARTLEMVDTAVALVAPAGAVGTAA